MCYLFLIFIALVFVIDSSLAYLYGDLIIQYCRSKNLTLGTVFSCMNKRERISMAKAFHEEGLRLLNLAIPEAFVNLDEAMFRKYRNYAIILDGDCARTNTLMIQSAKRRYFYEMYHWLVAVQQKEKMYIMFNGVEVNINADVHVAINEEQRNNWTIYDVYNPAANHKGKLVIKELGYYTENDGYQARFAENRYWIRKNMTGVHFKSAVVVPDLKIGLEQYLASENNREVDSMHRFQSVTVRHCRDMYNFSLHVQRTNSWGYIQADGHFDGLVSLLEKRLVDFGSSPLIYKLDRMPVVDYSFGNWILRSTFIYRRPRIIAKSYEIFLRPLENDVWITILLILAVIMIALKLTFGTEKFLLPKHHDSVDSSWSYLVLFTLGAFCQQGATCYPRLVSSRTLSVFVFIFCILVYQFYSASIVSYLLMDPPRTINSLGDLVESNLDAGIEDILIDRNYFQQTTDPYAIKLFKTKIKGDNNNSGFYEPVEGLERVRRGGFAFHVETSTAYPIIESTYSNEIVCELEEVQMYRTQPMHTNLQKNSPFRDMLNYCMLKQVEFGSMYRLRKYWDARTPSCIESAKKVEIHVSIKEFSCGLMALSYGITISFLVLVVEIIVCHKEFILTKILPRKDPIYPFVN